jgi:hypothetical protein
MTTVVTIANQPSSAIDVALKPFDQTKLLPRKQTASADGLTVICEYVYADGDPTTETSVSVRVAVDPKANTQRFSILLRSVQIVAVDSLEVERAPIEVTLGWTTPGPMEDSRKVLDIIGSAFCLAFDGVTTKVPNLGIIDALNRALVGGLYA